MDTLESDKGEKAHHMTTTVYKDLQTNFTHGLKAIWSSGKALHKSLEVTAQKAKAHYEAITILGQAASQSEGTVIGIGHALMQMAEIYKEIQHQADDNIAALKKELCNPLEFVLLDNSEKMEEKLKKYNKEHQKMLAPYKKSSSNLAKHRKKSKGVQNSKEMQYYREATENKNRLDRLRLKHLKDALFEEKKCYLFAFEKLLAVTKNHALYSRKSQELLGHKLGDWETLTQSKDMSKDALKVIESISEQTENNNENAQNGDVQISSDTSSTHSGSFPRSTNNTLSGTSPTAESSNVERPRVRAMYSHEGEGDNQLAFAEDDILMLYGNKRDGWHYGQNLRTKQFGWFPISFTKALRRQNSLSKESPLTASSKFSRSVADLTAPDSGKNHRAFFQHNNMNSEERSTMTLPHRKNNSSPASQAIRPDGIVHPHLAALSQPQVEQLITAQHLMSHQTTPVSNDVISSHCFHKYSPSNLFHPMLPHPPEGHLMGPEYANNGFCIYQNGNDLLHNHLMAQYQPDNSTSSHELYDNILPPFPLVLDSDVSQWQDDLLSPPLPPPPPSLSAETAGGSIAHKKALSVTLPPGFRRTVSATPSSPPPPPPPNMNQMLTQGHPALLMPGGSQLPGSSTANTGGPPPPPPISSMPRSNIPPPPPPIGGDAKPSMSGPAPPPPPPPLPPPGRHH